MDVERLDWVLSEISQRVGLFMTLDECAQKWGDSNENSMEYRLYAQKLTHDGLASCNSENDTWINITPKGHEFQKDGGYAVFLKRKEAADKKSQELKDLDEKVKRTALVKDRISIPLSIIAILISIASFLYVVFHSN